MLKFLDIFDQPAAVAAITQAYRADRLPHGLIFAGPAGVGKATTARALAQLFLCEKPKEISPCNRCESCRVFEAGNHPDFHVVTRDLIRYHDKTGTSKGIDLSIHVIRPELVEPAGRKAVMGRGKVFLIEQAESMNAAAQNALLKTLEEPAGRTLIILLTDQPDTLLATIRSRCQIVGFAALPLSRVLAELKKRGHDDATAKQAAAISTGSLGVAIQWIDDGVVARAAELAGQLDALAAGQAPDDLAGWMKKSADAYAEKQMIRDPLGSKDAATRAGLGLYLGIASEHLRRSLAEGGTPDELESVCEAIDALFRAESYIDANVNVALALQQLSLMLERQSQPG